jgi:hypothetical protein
MSVVYMAIKTPIFSRIVESISALVIEVVAVVVVLGAVRLAHQDLRTSPLLVVLIAAAAYLTKINLQSLSRILSSDAGEQSHKLHG